jgi:cobalamin biosynthetic protein CobC
LLEHGGGVRLAAARYRIPVGDWLDLSTGINPNGWPVPPVPASIWRRLPEDDDDLTRVAADYYGTDQLLPVAGSQAAIQALPLLRPPCRVGMLAPSYNEHPHAWRWAGHEVVALAVDAIETAVDTLDVLLLCHPNNPTGARVVPATLADWRARLAARGGWLVVDEAFMDATPEQSLAAQAGTPGLVILRSLGKFFGLAGVRVGFVLAEAALRRRLQESLGPWTVNGPGRWVATQALADRAWQERARPQLHAASARLAQLLTAQGWSVSGGTALFQWCLEPEAIRLQDALARRGIWIRRFDEPASLRLGLPGDETGWQRLERVLAEICARR